MKDHIQAIVIIDHDKMFYERRIVGFPPVGSWRAATPQGENRIAEYIENNVAEWDLETKNT